MERSLFTELIHCTQRTLDTISNFVQLSRGRFSDKEFGEFFYKAITKDIEKQDVLLNTFLKYIESTTPILKRDTLNKLVEETVKRHRLRLEVKKARIFRKFEKDLPETTLPDEQLRFILDSILQYAMALMAPGGNIEYSARLVILPGGKTEDLESNKRNGRFVETAVSFTRDEMSRGEQEKGLALPPSGGEAGPGLVLRLIEMVVQMNQGTMGYESDEKEGKQRIIMKLPIERRRIVHYQDENG